MYSSSQHAEANRMLREGKKLEAHAWSHWQMCPSPRRLMVVNREVLPSHANLHLLKEPPSRPAHTMSVQRLMLRAKTAVAQGTKWAVQLLGLNIAMGHA